jgi:hypothetical protein
MMGDDFTLVDCDYGPVLNVVEKAGFSFGSARLYGCAPRPSRMEGDAEASRSLGSPDQRNQSIPDLAAVCVVAGKVG